tara:strand:+ start:737 stop:931 length:195 start_codon:yes stop_codon:yes gene_type:complete
MDKLEKLINKYLELYPNSETPLNYYNLLGEDKLIEVLEQSNGREIKWIPNFTGDVSDGGEIQYI